MHGAVTRRTLLKLSSLSMAASRYAASVRASVAEERAKWVHFLDEQKLPHTDGRASFIFFDAGRPQPLVAAGMLARGVLIARPFAPYNTWCRITIGLPAQNLEAQRALKAVLAG